MTVSAPIQRAMVMAAGRGTRLRPLTNDRCKAMVDVGGKSLINWTLDKLEAAGVRQVVVNVHHFADELEAHLDTRTGGLEILISDERDQLMDTGGGLVRAAPMLGDDPVFVANIDALWLDDDEAELDRLAHGFEPDHMDFRLMLSRMGHNLGFGGEGDFHLEADARLKRRGEGTGLLHAYAGVQILHPHVLKGHPAEPFSTNILWNKAIHEGRLTGHPMNAFWMHVGDPDAHSQTQTHLASLVT